MHANSNPSALKQPAEEDKSTKVASSKTPMKDPPSCPDDSAPTMPVGKPRRSSLITGAQKVETSEPSMRKKAYCFDDPKHVPTTRFEEEEDASSERDLEFLHQ